MPQYLIERHLPGAAGLSAEQLSDIARKSVCAMKHLPGYRWEHTSVAGDRLYCVHEASSEEAVREHSRRGGFPILHITEIAATFGPQDAETVATAAGR